MNTFLDMVNNFHFLRPAWLLLLIPGLMFVWLLKRETTTAGSWHKVIAPELLPWLMHGKEQQKNHSRLWIGLWLLGSLAMAGPTWHKVPLPVHKNESPLVILFDLSPSMLATDLVPNRLTRSRLKLIDLLDQRKEGSTALIAYGGEAYVVSPLTDDAKTIASMASALHPGIIPVMGSNIEQATDLALQLLANTGHQRANLLLITDEVAPEGADALYRELRDQPEIKLSILGVGTEKGSPIPLGNGSFAKDNNGNIVMPRLNPETLRQLAVYHGGRFTRLTTDNTDLEYLAAGFQTDSNAMETLVERTADTWHDMGYLLVLPLLPLLLLLFRRGAITFWLLPVTLSFAVSLQQPAHALGWEDLWLTPDQQGAKALEAGDPETAEDAFRDPQWKAAAAYKNNDFATAEKLFSTTGTVEAEYNRGNALARQGKLADAIEAYDSVLEKQPDHQDAAHNRQLLEKLLNQQQNSQQSQGQGQNDSAENRQDTSQDQNSQGEANTDESSSAENQQGEQKTDPAGDDSTGNKNPEQGKPEPDQQPPQQAKDNSGQSEQDSDQTPDQEQQSGQAQTPADEQPATEDQQASQLAELPATDALSEEEQQEMAQWLRKIPDDPGGLLRKKFLYQSQQRAVEQQGQFFPPSDNTQRW